MTRLETAGKTAMLVAVDGDGVLGYASSSPHRQRQAYETSIETTAYVAHTAHGRGVGSAMYTASTISRHSSNSS